MYNVLPSKLKQQIDENILHNSQEHLLIILKDNVFYRIFNCT